MTEKRSQVVDFTITLTYDAAKLWQKIPNRSFSWFTFTNVFENQYWLFLGKNTADQGSSYKKLALSSKKSQCKGGFFSERADASVNSPNR